MENNKEKDMDKVLGMNRIMFFVIVGLLCILALSIGIYAQIFYRYSDTDPFMLGIGVGKTQEAAEITKMKNEFNTIFTNDVSGESTISDISKNKNDKDLVYTEQKITERENDKYNIVANIPYINIDSNIVGKINSDINKKYIDKIEKIIAESKEYQDYNDTQSAKITTYNYSLSLDREVTINDIIKAKGYDSKKLQKEIDTQIETLNKKDEELKNQYTEVRLRDVSNQMYKIENTENFIVNQDGYLYLIYAYGNKENTNKIDLIIFE